MEEVSRRKGSGAGRRSRGVPQDRGRSDVDAVPVGESQPVYPMSMVDEAIQTIGVFDHPRVVLTDDPGMETRDNLRWHTHVAIGMSADGKHGLIQHTLTHHIPIHFDDDSGIFRGFGFRGAIYAGRLRLPRITV